MKKFILSCDWGSTSFRLRLVDINSGAVIDELQTSEGIIHTFNAWKASSESGEDRKQYFIEYLKKGLNILAEKSSTDLSRLDIIISGMASSSIGMYELPYANLPFCADGSPVGVHIFSAEKSFQNRIILISGVKSSVDVIRGEETQLIGLVKLLKPITYTESIFILPGTHSKHLQLKENKLVDIKTYMTGELYNILAHQSILKDSVDVEIPGEMSNDDRDAFIAGVRNPDSANILNRLFSVRTNQLFNKLDKKQNALYLSGLLIGNELADLPKSADVPLFLCSGGALHTLYKLALECLGLLNGTTIVPVETLSLATVAGQIIIAQNHTTLHED